MREDATKSKKGLFIGLAVLLAVVGGGVWVLASRSDDKPPAESTTQQTPAATPETGVETVSYQGEDGKTALELLQTKAEVVTKDSSYGTYVDSINGVMGGTDGKYWIFYVNGQQATVGADAYESKAGDTIEWKFE